MPSWNIHIAQTERLLERGDTLARMVCDRNAFLFGNVVPDVLVGYMIPAVDRPLPYRITHFAVPEFIPKPREREFWDTQVIPLLEGGVPAASPVPAASIRAERERVNQVHYAQRSGADDDHPVIVSPDVPPSDEEVARSVFDMVLGAWAHLVADCVWNTRVNDYLDVHNIKPSEEFRVKKQGDFDWYGRTHAIELIPRATERLYAAAERFPQYPIERRFTLETVSVMHETVRTNGGAAEHLPYRLLDDAFFDSTFSEVVDTTERLFEERFRG